MEKTFILNEPLDMHLHLRDGDMLRLVAPLTSNSFSGALVMPNLVPPVTTKDALLSYKKRVIEACKGDDFTPYMTLFFQNNYSFEFLEDIKDEIIGIKLYPAGITTNSETGVSSMDIEVLRPTLENMSRLGIPLCIHGETNGFVMDREKEFMPIYESLAIAFPNLKIVMEHITTKDAVELLDKYSNLYATVTLHHLLITLDDVAGGMLDPHLFCKPIAKRLEDRNALLNAALKAHPKHKKECCGCASGLFTSPIALQVLVELFEKHDSLENLNDFVSNNAKKIYGLDLNKKRIKLIKKDFVVPDIYEYKDEKVVPMYAGKTISWSIDSIQK